MNRITLEKIDTLPSESILAKLVEKAHQNRESFFALPFAGAGGGRFVLAVTFSSSKRNIPRWYLFAGDDDGAPIVWMRETANREEILLILSGRASRAGDAPKEPDKPKVPVDTLLKAADFDQASYYQFYQRLIDPDTGMFPVGAFYWFLSQELVRYQRTKTAFSLILLDAQLNKGSPDKQTFSWIGQVLTSQMRKLDYVCNLNGYIAILLAASELDEAVTCATRLSNLVSERSAVRNPESSLVLFAGVAAVPESCEHPGVLISAAELALDRGITKSVKVTPFDPEMVVPG
jgi:GGDEF domain-containing protein